MPIMWSRIHLELGLTTPTPLTHAMVISAVEAGVAENVDLDWKQELPSDTKRAEFAKDVALLANSRGGLIVYGVREENERAQGLTPVSNGERERQRLRALAHGRVRPMVDGLVIEALDDENGERGLLAVFVPSSPDAPHVIGDQNQLGVPYRDGTDTRWMTESLLERAYRDRFARRADDRAALEALIQGLLPEIDPARGVWMAVATRAIAPIPALLGRPERGSAVTAMAEVTPLVAELVGSSAVADIKILNGLPDDAVRNPRSGLRRWVFRSNHYSTDPLELVDWAVVELHHDGAIALAVRLDEFAPRPETDSGADFDRVSYRVVDALVAQAVALAVSHVRGLGGVGTNLIRAQFLRDEGDASPLVAIDNRIGGGHFQSAAFHQVPGSRAVRRPLPVEAQFAVEDDVETLRGVIRQLADDLDQQFGISQSSVPR